MDSSSSKDQACNPSVEKPGEVLSPEQQAIIDDVLKKKSIFITGSAGVGKSFLLQKIMDRLPKKKVYVTASTGVAACNIGGSTLHSFAGIGLGDKAAEVYGRQILFKNYKIEVKQRWTSCQTLIVDEISMVDGNLFQKVEEVARIVRKDQRPFGGIQLILCGDFLQLPPVKCNYFAFETKAWKRCINKTIVLGKVFRQKHFGFVSLLNRLRVGFVTSSDIEVLHHCHRTLFPDDGIKATCLFPLRSTCDRVNQSELQKLKGKAESFDAFDFYKDENYKRQLENTSRFPKKLVLKVGAQVMLLTNKDVRNGLVNGARGVVISFFDMNADNPADALLDEHDLIETDFSVTQENKEKNLLPVVKFANQAEMLIKPEQHTIEVAGKTMAYRSQVPLLLAWAVSVHKSQGVTLDRVEVNLAKAFEHGQSYVALSRVTSLDGLLLRAFDPQKITAHPKVLEYYTSLDPGFPHCTKSMGVTDLEGFINERKDYKTYKKRIDCLTRSLTAQKEEAYNILIEHSYGRIDLSQLKLSIPPPSPATPASVSNTSPSAEKCSSINRPSTSKAENSKSSQFVIDLTSECSSSKSHESTPVAQKLLSKAEQILAQCKQGLDSLNKPIKISDDDSLFGDEDDDLLDNELMKIDESSVIVTPKKTPKKNNFLDNICPDLLKCSQNSSSKFGQQKRNLFSDRTDNNNAQTPPRSGKRRLEAPCSVTPKDKRLNTTGRTESEVKRSLSKEQAMKMEENRRKALARRYQSLQRMSST